MVKSFCQANRCWCTVAVGIGYQACPPVLGRFSFFLVGMDRDRVLFSFFLLEMGRDGVLYSRDCRI